MAMRAATRALAEAKKSNERFYLIYWPEELCVSMHSSEEVLGTEGRVGDDVPVLYNKETLKGQIAGVGNRAEMVQLEKDFISGSFTPFEEVRATSSEEEPRISDAPDPQLHSTPKSGRGLKRKRLQAGQKKASKVKKTPSIGNGKRGKGANVKKSVAKEGKGLKEKGSILTLGVGADEIDLLSSNTSSEEEEDSCQVTQGGNEKTTKNKGKKEKPQTSGVGTSGKDLLSCSSQEEDDQVAQDQTSNSKEVTSAHSLYPPDFSFNHLELERYHDNDAYLEGHGEESHQGHAQKHAQQGQGHAEQGFPQQVQPVQKHTQPFQQHHSHGMPAGHGENYWPMGWSSASTFGNYLPPHTPFENQNLQNQLSKVESKLDSVLQNQSTILARLQSLETSMPQQPPARSSSASSATPTPLFPVQKCPLPDIDKSKLIAPEEVRRKYERLVCSEKITRFAVRLAKEAFFGKEVMSACTMLGNKMYHPIPKPELAELKEFLYRQAVPAIYKNHSDWEAAWKACWEQIGQSCKNLRGN